VTIDERRRTCEELRRRYYAGVPSRDALLGRAVSGLLAPSAVLMDAGCGAELTLLRQYAPKVTFAVGVDVEAPRLRPPANASVLVGNLEQIPLAADSVDLVVSRSVFEHLERPERVLAEIRRILRPHGRLVFTTPNRYYYSCLIARLIPESAKAHYFRTVFGDDAYDYFPVHYRANTRRSLRKLAASTGLRVEKIEAIRHFPFYFVFSPLLFRLGTLYDYLITWLGLDSLQSNWLVVMTKSAPARAATEVARVNSR
jgi:SAM-dependent methyltransferase